MKQKFDVTGMTCSACSAHVEKSVSKVNGVSSVNVSLLTNSMVVEYDEKQTTAGTIISAVKNGGYGASLHSESATPKPKVATNNVSLSRLIISLSFCVVLMYVAMGHMINLPLPGFLTGHNNAVSFALVQLLLCLPVWYVNRNYFIVGFKRLFTGSPNMDTLIAVGSSAGAIYAIVVTFVMSYALGSGDMATVEAYHHQLYFESSSMILALVDLGKYFEGRSKQKTGDALNKLKNLAPQKAILFSADGTEQQVEVSLLKSGDVVIVKAGMSFPADGTVIYGSCFADESAISGESLPVEKLQGASVIGGTVNVGGFVRVQLTSVGSESTLSKIIALVEDASSSKAPIQRLADKISSVFVPVVMSISAVTLIVWLCVGYPLSTALNFAISVLVISCPCALGLATPVAIMVSTGKSAQNGILVKNGETLENLSKIKYVALDKTGTITVGKPQVKKYQTSIETNQFFSIIGGIERQSEHPLGKAVVDYCQNNGIDLATPQNYQTIAGKGVVATVNNSVWAIGNKALMADQNVTDDFSAVLSDYSSHALTCLIVSKDGKFIGIVGVGDEIKPTSKQAVAEMKALGLTPVLITGDNNLSAKAVADEVGIDEFYAEVLPQQKEQIVSNLLNKGSVAMVGDGINDAPALAKADVGIAVSSGSDIAVDSAQVVLVKNDLRDVATAVSLSKKTVTNIKQNLFWAFFYNVLGIPLAAGVLYATSLHLQLNPMIASAAMSLSSLFVVTNALRLNFFKPPKVLEGKSKSKANLRNSTEQLKDVPNGQALQNERSQSCNNQNCNQSQQNSCQSASQNVSVNNLVEQTNNSNTQNSNEESTMKYVLQIEGMMCEHCVAHVTQALTACNGVTDVQVSLQQKNAVVSGSNLSADELTSAVKNQGYKVKGVKEL